MKTKGLCVLSFGGGQDSTAILYKLIFDDAFRTAIAKHGNMTDKELIEYKHSHGHCIANGY